MKQDKKKARQRLYKNRADPATEDFIEQNDGFAGKEDTPEENTTDTEAGKQARKRRNRKNAQRIRKQLNIDKPVFQKQKSDFAGNAKSGKAAFPDQKEYSLEKTCDPKTGKTSYKMVTNHRKDIRNKKRNHPVSGLNSRTKELSADAMDFLHDQNGEEDDNSATEAAGTGIRTTGRFQDFIIERAEKKKDIRKTEKKRVDPKEERIKADFRGDKKKKEPVSGNTFKQETPFIEKKKPEADPDIKKKAVQKRIQKQHIKHDYARAFRNGEKISKTSEYAGKAVKGTATAVKKAAEMIVSNIHVIFIAGVLILILFAVITLVSSCAVMFSGGIGNVMTGSYQSLPAEIDKAENSMTLKEMRLQNRIDRIETDYPDYDEYTYNLAPIEHDPYELINFLSAKYIDFTADDVESEIQYLFNHMYQLILTEREEERTRTVTKTRPVIDPETGLETGEEEEYEEEEEYTARILDVKLTSIPLLWIIRPQLMGETAELFTIYSETKGAVQRFYTPLDMDWQGSIKSYYGYRKNPQTGANEFHRGLDISVPYGTNVYASQSGTVTEASYSTGYGNYIVIEDSKGYMTKYAHLSSRYVSSGQTVEHGQLIGRTGNTGSITGSHLHIECLYNGDHYNPLFYVENGSDSSLTGTSEASAISGTQTEVLLNEADRYVGYPYTWGGSSPETGFDCSGFVCFVLADSGYADMPRTTAQGICNRCRRITPQEAEPGDIIFFTGTYNSGNPVSHVGIYCGNGKMIHAGDPVKYSSINTPYWQSHFYGFGRINPDS